MARSHSPRDGTSDGAGEDRPPVALPERAHARVIIRHPANDNRRPISTRIRSMLIASMAVALAAGLVLYQLS